MDESYKSISDNIKSGQYYIDAKIWYLNRFVNPFVERNIVIFFISIMILAICILFFNYTLINRGSSVEYLLSNDDINDTYAVIQELNKKDPQESLEHYMIKLYISKKESYNYNTIDEQLKFIKNHSNNSIYKKFANHISINNSDSPVLVYGKDNFKKVKIHAIEQHKENENSYIVRFSTIMTSTVDSNEKEMNWIAKINFNMSDIYNMINEEITTLDFKVTEYVVRRLN